MNGRDYYDNVNIKNKNKVIQIKFRNKADKKLWRKRIIVVSSA